MVEAATEPKTTRSRAKTKAEATTKPKATPRVRRRSTVNGEISSISIAKGLGKYLDECRRLGLAKTGQKPMSQRSTESIEKSIVKHEARLSKTTSLLVELQERSLLLELRAVLAERGEGGGPSEAQQFFVRHAAAWAEGKGVSHYAFREMGVPVAVLREAGIKA